jgi:hypothetical protein
MSANLANAIARDMLAKLVKRKSAAPVSMKGRMTGNGFQPENHEWLDQLLERNEHGKLVGRNPMEVPLDLLRNAGHPPRRTAALVAAWSDRGDEPLFAPVKEVRDIRNHCLECSAGVAREVRECRIINCPFWAFRTGRNPHNPQRGKRPLFGSKSSATAEFDAQNVPDKWSVATPGDNVTSNLQAGIPEALSGVAEATREPPQARS